MSTNPNLPAGFSITSINGVRCTAVPRSLTTLAPNQTVVPFANAAVLPAATVAPAPAPPPLPPPPPPPPSSPPPPSPPQRIATPSPERVANPPPQAQNDANQPEAVAVTANTVNPQALAQQAAPSEEVPRPATDESINNAAAQSPTSAGFLSPAAAASTGVAAVQSSPAAASPQSLADLLGDEDSTLEVSSDAASIAGPGSNGTIPAGRLPTALPQGQSEELPVPTPSTNSLSEIQNSPASTTPSEVAPSQTPIPENVAPPPGISASPRASSAPVIGGVVGSFALMAMVTLLIWLLRRRKRRGRVGAMSPVEHGGKNKFYEIDNGSVGPTKRTTKWKEAMDYRLERAREAAADMKASVAGLGVTFKAKIVRKQSSMPGVNLNRGNSQFFDGPISQHSRNNSSISAAPWQPSGKGSFAELLKNISQLMGFKKSPQATERRVGPYNGAMTEKRPVNNSPDFSQLLAMDERLEVDRRHSRNLSTSSIPQLGSLGLDFASHDPFADPISSKPASNPFVDTISTPQPSVPAPSTYITNIRRSRGQSMDVPLSQTITNEPVSRYPSTIATRDSYRDTVFSVAPNTRKGKGRSDPFDLERPELFRQLQQENPPPPQPRLGSSAGDPPLSATYPPAPQFARAMGLVNGARVQSVVHTPRIVSQTGSYGSKYTSGASSFNGWGDPGPDLGPGSGANSVRADVLSVRSDGDFDWDVPDDRKGTAAEVADISPMSTHSKGTFKAVGKAM